MAGMQKPITASAIQELYTYYTGVTEEFNLSDYHGLALVYPDGFKRPDGTPVLNSSGEPIYARVLTGRISFSDFLGSAGYFAAYPSPSIFISQQPSNKQGTSNVGETTHTIKLSVSANASSVPFWRPKISKIVTTVQWQRSTNNSTWSNYGSAQTYETFSTITSTITETNGNQGTIYWRAQVSAESFALDDDNYPATGQLGSLRVVSSASKTSSVAKTVLEAYQPDEPEIRFNTHKWSKQASGGRGDYVITLREVDQVILSAPALSLTFNGKPVGEATFFDAPGRSPTTNTVIEWEVKNTANIDNPDWMPVSELTFDYTGSPYDSDTFGFSASDTGLSTNDNTDIRFDDLQFRAKVTATQTLSAPSEINELVAYSPVYSVDVAEAILEPVYTLTGTNAVVNGGTFTFTFSADNVGTRDYYYQINDPADDFIDESGVLGITNNGSANFSISTRFDGDTTTESFLLEVFDTLTDQRVITKTLNIVYGTPKYYIATPNTTISEDGAFELEIRAENVGDTTVYFYYTRTVADSTGDDDFKIGGSTLASDTNRALNLTVDTNLSDNDVIVSTGKVTLTAINDSPFGGEVGNYEQFKFYVRETPTSSPADNITVTVNDALNFQIDLFGGFTPANLNYSTVSTYNSTEITARGHNNLNWIDDPAYHVSWGNYTLLHVQYRWQVKSSTSGNDWVSLGDWQEVGHSGSYNLYNSTTGQINSNNYNQLEFTDWARETINIGGLGVQQLNSLHWRVVLRATTTTGLNTSKASNSVTMTVTRNDGYINTGIYSVYGSGTEGSMETNITVRSRGMIGQTVKIKLTDPELSGYLIDFPKFGPMYPHDTPVSEKEITISSNTQTVDMGGWLYHVYGFTNKYITFDPSGPSASNRMQATATALTGYTDSGYGNKNGWFSVTDADPQLFIGSPNRLGTEPVIVRPGDTFTINLFGRNLRARNDYIYGHDFGMGFTIRETGSPGGEIGSAGEWFFPQSSYDDVGASDVFEGQNFYDVEFDRPEAFNPSASDYFTFAYARKEGMYRVPGGVTIQVTDNENWFEPKNFYAQPQSFAASSASTLNIVLAPKVEKPAEYTINLRKQGSAPFTPEGSFSVIAEIVGEEPNDRDHTWEIEHLTFGGAAFSQMSGDLRLDYPSEGSDEIPIRPLAGSQGLGFTVKVYDSAGNLKGSKDFEVGYTPLSVSITDISANVPIPVNPGFRLTHPRFFFRKEKIDAGDWEYTVVWDGDTVFGREYIDYNFPPDTVRGTNDYNYSIGSPAGQQWMYNVVSNAPISAPNPEGTSVATVTGGTGVYTYEWSHSIIEGGIEQASNNGAEYYVKGTDSKVTATIRCKVTDSAGSTATAAASLKFNQNRAAPPDPEPDVPALTATINGTIDSRIVIEYNGGDDGYTSDSVRVNVAGGSGSYLYQWTFEPRSVTRVTLSGSGENSATLTGAVTGKVGLNYLPPGTVGSASGIVTCTITDRVTGARVSASCNVYLSITVKDQTAGGSSGGGSTGGGGGRIRSIEEISTFKLK